MTSYFSRLASLQCLTIFSASNYYGPGSNRGAYVVLQGAELRPHFVQFTAQTKTKYISMRQRVGALEASALVELRKKILASKQVLMHEFKKRDPSGKVRRVNVARNFNNNYQILSWDAPSPTVRDLSSLRQLFTLPCQIKLKKYSFPGKLFCKQLRPPPPSARRKINNRSNLQSEVVLPSSAPLDVWLRDTTCYYGLGGR